MSKNIGHLQHIKSNVVIEGKPKLPTAEVLVDGELAVNYAEGYETISLRNSNSGITTFSSDDYYTKKKLGSGFTGVNSANTVTSVIEENEEIISSALNDLEGRKLDASAYTPTDLSNYYTKSETSGSTEISNALGVKVNSATYIAHTADTTIHFTTGTVQTQIDNSISGKVNTSDIISEITPSNSGSTAPIATKVIAENELIISNALNDLNTAITAHTADTNVHFTTNDRLKWETLNRRTRKNFTDSGMTYFINTLKSAIADQDLEKYGLKVGDYCTATHNGKTYNYVIAGLNTMRGTSTPYRLNYDHVGIIVDTDDRHAWNTGGTTSASTNTHSTNGTWTSGTPAAGYASCDLQYYLETTVLPNVKTDLGSGNIKSHSKLYSNAVNTSGYNRYGSPGGCSSSWAWYANQEICALSEVQVYGSIVWSSSGFDTGEACRQLDVFRVYNMNEIFEGHYPWLRDVASSSSACRVGRFGHADSPTASNALYVAALILFA